MNDDLQQFHARNMENDPQYAVARQLLELGEAVLRLRQAVRMTRGDLAKLLHVKAQDIAVIEQETPRAPAGLLETALIILLHRLARRHARTSEVSASLRVVRHLRPALLAA